MADMPMETYAVAETCIACDACCNDFGDVFKMNAEHTLAIAYAPVAKGRYDPWDIIYDCPVDAISLIKGELPPPPEGKKKKSTETAAVPEPGEVTDSRPWEVRWAEAQSKGEEGYWERFKRYGEAYVLEETPNQYRFRFELPSRVPEHKMKYKWNLPDKMPDYKIDVKLNGDGKRILVKGWLEDARVKRLCGMANSFPDRFLREIDLSHQVKEITTNYNPAEKVLDIIVNKQ